MAGPNNKERIGVYIACGGAYPEDATILLGKPREDLVKLVKPGSLHVKSVAPGVNLEKTNGAVAGVSLFRPPVNSDEIEYDQIDSGELDTLEHVIDALEVALRSFKTLIKPLTQAK